jgi:hypothetical protein
MISKMVQTLPSSSLRGLRQRLRLFKNSSQMKDASQPGGYPSRRRRMRMKRIRSLTGFRSLITLEIAVCTGLRAERITSLISHHSTSGKNLVSVVNIINNRMMDR